jgi:hypothetical protein
VDGRVPGGAGAARRGAGGALALTIILTLALKATHAPAAATTLLVALGSLRSPADALSVGVGAAILALAGIAVRELRLGHWPRRRVTHSPAPAGEPAVTRPAAPEMKKAA